MALWDIDLSTEDGALGAAQLGGVACFVAAGLGVLALVFMWELMRIGAVMPLAGLFALVEILAFVAAGFRLRAGKGVRWGVVAAALLVIELLSRLLIGAFSAWMILSVILIIVIINGIRGARALRAGTFDAEAVAEIFN